MPRRPNTELIPTSDTETADIDNVAASLQFSVTRLARLLRQQDQGGMAPPLATALASIRREGPITLSRLATIEQVTPPTITKIIDRLVTQGFILRQSDPSDRRLCRVAITDAGSSQLETIRSQRAAWLSEQLRGLDPADVARLQSAIEVLETLIAIPAAGQPPEEAP